MEISSFADAALSVHGLSVGPARTPLAACSERSRAALGLYASRAGWPLLARRIARQAPRDLEVVHFTDLRLAPFGCWLRRRRGVAVSVDVSPRELVSHDRRTQRMFDAVNGLDAAFVFGAAGERTLRKRARSVPSGVLPLVACGPADPPARLTSRIERALSNVPSGRPILAVPWTSDLAQWRMLRRDLIPAVGDSATLFVVGIPDRGYRTELRMLFGRTDVVRTHVARLDDALVSAVARVADAFFVPWRLGGGAPEADGLIRLGLAASGLPLIATDGGAALEHERNAFLFRHGDGVGVRATLDRLFALPARQRHYVGAEFASDVLSRYSAAAALGVYGERFDALAGRPQVPDSLRAAA